MNKLCRLIAATFVMAMSTVTAKPRLKIKPALSISLNKRSISTDIESKYYLEDLQGSTGFINKFATQPFGTLGTTYQSDNYLGPGLTYIEDNTFVLKKSGAAKADAATTDAINGDKLLTLLYPDNITVLGLIDTNGKYYFPITSVSTIDSVSTLSFPNYSQSWDGLTEVLQGSPTYSYVTSGTDELLTVTTDFNSGLFNATGYVVKKYYTQDSSKKYYIIMSESVNSPSSGNIVENSSGYNINNFGKLIQYDVTTDADTYTQTDYEHIDYYGITLELAAEYALTDFLYFNFQSDITTPIEKITHTGKFLSVKPEADFGIKGGLSIGNSNGNLGISYGIAYDRYTAQIRRLNTAVAGRYLENNLTKIKTFTTCREIHANIRVTPQMDAHFATVITGSGYTIDLKGSTSRSPVTNQRFSVGLSMNY